jgi:nucleotide-binding universal stress UspA family protein
MKLDRIVVGVDGSDNATAAVTWAAELAAKTGAEVVAVHALGLLERFDSEEPVAAQPNRDEIRQRFETTWCAPLTDSGVAKRCVFRDGNPVSVVLAVADEEDADLVVLGSRGLGGYPEQLLGSTSTQVAQRSHRPVTIVPTGAP